MRKRRMLTLFAIAFALAQVSLASAETKSIVVASTTSAEDSGLFRHILPLFKQKTGIDVKVAARGTGQALDMARRVNGGPFMIRSRPWWDQRVLRREQQSAGFIGLHKEYAAI